MIPRLGYVPGRSFLHGLDPRTKLIALVSSLILLVTFDSPLLLGSSVLLVLLLFLLAGLSPRLILAKTRFIVCFAFLIFVSYLIFVQGGRVLFSIDLFSLGQFKARLIVSQLGVTMGLATTFRFLGIVFASLLFVAVTDPSKLAYALMRSGLPYRYGFMFIIALRFIPLFDMEASVVQQAQRARGLEIDVRGPKRLWRQVKYTFLPLLSSALSRVDSISISMESRALGISKKRTYLRETKFRARDKAISGMVIALTTILLLFDVRMLPHIPFSL
ncbi:MAG: energy-coupling factor transporter transmembrane protein EcfT [Thermoplasmata archaeon]|nr:energy-coupling factor transporter transmembrane protein EcfT [Thermoplasmata archaeon]